VLQHLHEHSLGASAHALGPQASSVRALSRRRTDLTQRFGVSRSTMRAVLVQLAQEGYVTSEVNRGVRTRDLTVEEALDILKTRETLESDLAGKAAERATEEEIEELRRTLQFMAGCQASGDQAGYSQVAGKLVITRVSVSPPNTSCRTSTTGAFFLPTG
jgi:Mn-dependent DtxR family transcriptional regulator